MSSGEQILVNQYAASGTVQGTTQISYLHKQAGPSNLLWRHSQLTGSNGLLHVYRDMLLQQAMDMSGQRSDRGVVKDQSARQAQIKGASNSIGQLHR